MLVDTRLIEAVGASSAQLGIRAVESFRAAGFLDAAWEQCDSGALIAMGPGRFVNRAIGVGLGGTSAAEVLDQVERFYDERGLSPCVEVCPWASDLIAEMSARGYLIDDIRDVYIHTLDELPHRSSIEIREVPDDGGVDGPLAASWVEILASNSEPESAGWHRDIEFFKIALQMPQRINLAAYIDGSPSSTASLSIVGSIVEFGAATTLASARGRGAQQALIAERLHRTKELGCEYAVVVSIPGSTSARNLQRAGFQLLFNAVLMRRP